MKKQFFAFLAMSLVAILILGACSSGAETTMAPVAPTAVVQTEPAVVEPTEPAAVVQTEPAAEMTDAEMEALIAEKAHDQHTLDFILSKDMSAEEWSETLDRMIGYGAKISPEEKALIIDWLVNRNK